MTEDIAAAAAAPARPRVPRKLLVAGLAGVAVAVAAVVVFWPGAERFDSVPALLSRLEQVGAPCTDFRELDETSGLCRAGDRSFVVAVVDDGAVADQVREAAEDARYAVAAGDGWYIGGDGADYLGRVAGLLGGDFHP